MNRDEGAHFLMSSTRTLPAGRLLREKLGNHQLWSSTLYLSVQNCQSNLIFWFWRMKCTLPICELFVTCLTDRFRCSLLYICSSTSTKFAFIFNIKDILVCIVFICFIRMYSHVMQKLLVLYYDIQPCSTCLTRNQASNFLVVGQRQACL